MVNIQNKNGQAKPYQVRQVLDLGIAQVQHLQLGAVRQRAQVGEVDAVGALYELAKTDVFAYALSKIPEIAFTTPGVQICLEPISE